METRRETYSFCPYCGKELDVLLTPPDVWLKAYRCSNFECHKTFIQILDMRNIYPLIETFPNIPDKLMSASNAMKDKATSRIKAYDNKTVSIVDFEKTLLEVMD